MRAQFSPSYGHLKSFSNNKITVGFLNLIQYFFLILDFLKLILDILNIKKNVHFLWRYDFSKLYLLYMMEFGHLIS